MEREIQITQDGSYTVAIPEMNVTYHSTHGALQESLHIYIQSGLLFALPTIICDTIYVFDMGFGTGLNALLTLIESERLKKKVYYYSVERYPLTIEEAEKLNYDSLLNTQTLSLQLHRAEWEKEVEITEYFTLFKTCQSLLTLELPFKFDVIYFDAFAPTIQPDLWSEDVFRQIFNHLNNNGVLTTYSSKVVVRRAMKAAGFIVEKLAGPKGKAEIVRARRMDNL